MTKLTISEIKLLKTKMNSKREAIAKLLVDLDDDTSYMQDNCKHPKSYAKIAERYYGGSFEDHAQTSTTPYCSLCGLKGKTNIIEYDYFG